MDKGKAKVVFGNGFDLFCGLNTSYSDFFEWRFKNPPFLSDDIYEKDIDRKTINTLIDNFYFADMTFWDVLFYYEKHNKKQKKIITGNNWCDIEKFILDFFTKKEDVKSLFDIVYDSYINFSFTYEDKYDWVAKACIYMAYRYKPNKNMTKIDFAAYLLEELKKFESVFGKYVKEEFNIKNSESHYNARMKIVFDNIRQKWEISNIDTFNYTCLEEKTYDNVRHVNGDDKMPIFGIDSKDISSKSPYYMFTKTYRRMMGNFYEGDRNDCFLDRNFDSLIVFGHSLNEQDYNYFFPIFDYMDLTNVLSKKTIIIYYNIYLDKNVKEKITKCKYKYNESDRIAQEVRIKKNILNSLVGLIDSYEDFKTGRKEHRLVDALTSEGRIRFEMVYDEYNDYKQNDNNRYHNLRNNRYHNLRFGA